MISSLRFQGVLTIFYNLRRSVSRALRSLEYSPGEFHHCNSEDEVYKVIRSHNRNRPRSRSLVGDDQWTDEYWVDQDRHPESFTRSLGRLNWATQSGEAF